MKKLVLLTALLLASVALQAGELVFHWNKICESKIFDLELMPDNDYFVIVTANEFQVRRTEDGEIFKTYPKDESFKQHDIEFSIDSTKIFLSYGEVIEKRSVEDFSLIKTYTMPPAEEGYSQRFLEIKVDPKKPYIYALERQWWVGTPGLGTDSYGICIYNYETMEKVADITPTGFEHKYYENMAISNDGKYLSFINQGESYLVTIDLSTQKELQRFKICNNYSDGGGSGGVPVCIKFSELNSDKIYFSGNFPQSLEGKHANDGLYIYSIKENKIIDSSFGVGENRLLDCFDFLIFDNDSKLIFSGYYLSIINLIDMSIEYKKLINYGEPGSWLKIKNKDNKFIGYSAYISMGIYEPNVSVKEIEKDIKTVYPNPTTGRLNIELNCISDKLKFELYEQNGLLIKSGIIENSSSIFQLDISKYANSIYFIKLFCGSDIQTFKIIKEN